MYAQLRSALRRSSSGSILLGALVGVVALLAGCATSSTVTEGAVMPGVVGAAPTLPPLSDPTPPVEPVPAEPTPVATSTPAPPAPTAAPAQPVEVAPTPAPAPATQPVAAGTSVGSIDERLVALDEMAVGFIDPQKLNDRIDLGSDWNPLGSAELHQGTPESAGPIPEPSDDMNEWCTGGVYTDAAKAGYWSQREWLTANYELPADPYVWTSVYDTAEDARDSIERERLVQQHCVDIELTDTYEDASIEPWTHVTTIHPSPAGHEVSFTRRPDRDSGWISMSLQAGPVVSHISMIGVDEDAVTAYLPALDSVVDGVVTAYEASFAIAAESSSGTLAVQAASTEGGEGTVGDYPRAESPWVGLNELLDFSDAPKIEASRLDDLIDETYRDRAGEFDEGHRDCMAVQGAVGERKAGRSVSSIILPLYGRYCAPELHADWWADGESIMLDDPEERRCLAHIVFQAEVTSASNGLLELSWPDLEPVTRIIVLGGLRTHCGLSEADAVRAGLTPTAPLEPSPELIDYCRAVAVHDTWRIDPPSMLRFFDKLVEIYAEIEPPPGVADRFPAFQAFNAEVAAFLAEEPELDQWDLAEHPRYIAAKATYDIDVVRAEIEEFNRANCIG